MSKELAFTDDNDVVKYLDTTTAFNLALTADGVAFDLTNAKSVLVKIANDDGYIMQQTIDLATVTSPLGGTLSFPINQDIMNTLVPDDYDIEVWVTMKDGTQAIFPSDGTLGFSIEENLMSDTGEVIPVITFDQFNDQFNDMMEQMRNTVSNVKKGDKGDTGPQGPQGVQGPKGDRGIQGIQGNTGTGISSTTIQYQISSSATTAPTGIWSNNIIATTTTNPYLWMKATLNYTDHTTKVFYLVSQKGDKGDTGSTGPIGPIGPRGPVGSGLVVKGTVKDASQLPTAGNQEGYCYFIGTDLYVWDAGAWKNCGSVSPDLSKYVTVTDLNNGLSNKVTDNRDGTEQLNGVKVQPFNKLSDSVGGRNLLLGTSPVKVLNPTWNNIINVDVTKLVGTTLTYSAIIDITGSPRGFVSVFLTTQDSSGKSIGDVVESNHINFGKVGKAIATITIPVGASNLNISEFANYTLVNPRVGSRKLEQGSIATDWTPAPEDKVNVSDMRKPASDVAGLEEVNAKQDKIAYTPADDSKVAHLSGANNFDTVPTVNNNPLLLASSLPSDLARTGQDTNFTRKLQKSGIDVATTTDVKNAVNTATANMVDSSKPTNFTRKLQQAGSDVITQANWVESDSDTHAQSSSKSNTEGFYYTEGAN
ncbi:hypothetical protein [Lentilactobacillus kefiri]|uniref:hypothetical protein n=1 Tax=Lentilactobacillus kefiri TaxID=33962 RepID=UPI00246870AE|nr:hypothetical protein [Lentilactobacillus kefiri]MDH5107749.1 hypothetical protein [Lentilactobacillus kefiri]